MKKAELLPLVAKNNTWGFINTEGQWVIPPRYEAASHFSDGLALVKSAQGIGFVNLQADEVIPCQFFDSLGFWEGFASVARADHKSGVKWGLIDKQGRWAIEPLYDFLGPLFQGRTRFNQRGRWGYLESQGQVLLPPSFDWAGDYIDGIARVQEVTHILKTYYIDLKAQPIGPHFFDNGEDFCNGMAGIYKEGKWGLINSRGEVMIVPRYEAIGEFAEGKLPVSIDSVSWHFVDASGARLFVGDFQEAQSFQEGWARVAAGNKWGFIDGEGRWCIPPTFDYIEDFCQGWALFRSADRVGYINRAGRIIANL